MGSFRTAFPALAACVGLAACDAGPVGSGDRQGWHRSHNAYADHFQVWNKGEERLVLVFGHGGETDTVGAYWLGQVAGAARPPVPAMPLSGPLTAVALGSTTHVPYISALGQQRTVVACAHKDQVRTSAFLEHARKAAVKEIATGDGLDREALALLRPQVLFGYPFGRGDGRVLESLGIPTIEVSEYLEEHPLGRAEWLRFFGALFGEERKADSLFAAIRTRYERLRVDTTTSLRPSVLFGSVWNGQWWVPPGNSYMARLIADAGGRYVFADRNGEGNIAVDMETMLTVGAKADRWGMIADLPGVPSSSDFTGGDERLRSFRAVQGQGLFIGNTRDSDLFGEALIEPDRVLADLRWLFLPLPRPDISDDGPSYFRSVAPDPTGGDHYRESGDHQ